MALRDCRLNSKWHSPYCHFFTLKSVKFLTFSQLFINKKFQTENRNILFILEQVDKAKVFCCKSGTWSTWSTFKNGGYLKLHFSLFKHKYSRLQNFGRNPIFNKCVKMIISFANFENVFSHFIFFSWDLFFNSWEQFDKSFFNT